MYNLLANIKYYPGLGQIMPIVERHRHFGGSISPSTVHTIMAANGQPFTMKEIISRMTYSKKEIGKGFKPFLEKFSILDEVHWSEWAIDESISQVCKDIATEGIKHVDISLSPNKYMKDNKWSIKDALKFVSRSFLHHTKRNNITCGLLLALRYDSSRAIQQSALEAINDSTMFDKWIGIDLIGNELFYDPIFYKKILDRWHRHDKVLRAHVGELPGTARHVKSAILDLDANRIAHGIYASNETLKLAIDKGVYFDLAIHSNIYTGVINNVKKHPAKRMMDMGCKITLNTDDPIQFGCTLREEMILAQRAGLNSSDIKRAMTVAAEPMQVDRMAVDEPVSILEMSPVYQV